LPIPIYHNHPLAAPYVRIIHGYWCAGKCGGYCALWGGVDTLAIFKKINGLKMT